MQSCGHQTFFLMVEMEPQPQQRVKVWKKHGVEREESRKAKALIREAAQAKMNELNLKVFHEKMPVSVVIDIYKTPPKRLAQWEREAGLRDLMPPLTRPDVDNYEKLILDSLTGIVYKDDNQVFSCKTTKHYTDNPRIEVSVWGHFVNVGDIKDMISADKKRNR